jgi:hypothetical protein
MLAMERAGRLLVTLGSPLREEQKCSRDCCLDEGESAVSTNHVLVDTRSSSPR